MHIQLRHLVLLVLADLDGRFTPYTGYRGQVEQEKAFARRTSRARFGESPHNFRPALACDVVLDPRRVSVLEAADPKNPGFPDLWGDGTEEAAAAWHALELAAAKHGLERVMIPDPVTGALVRDRPHLQLHNWRSLIRR